MTLREYFAALVYPSSEPSLEVRSRNERPHERGPNRDQALETGANRSRLVEGKRSVVYECRRCGTTVADDSTDCPYCERQTIAEYPVD